MTTYLPEIEQAMQKYYAPLGEKDRRRYAAVEALKLGAEGPRYIAQLLRCSEKTVRRGMVEFGSPAGRAAQRTWTAPTRGGRKGYNQTHPNIDEQFLAVLKEHTAGDAMGDQVV
jgi:hypothetical protein